MIKIHLTILAAAVICYFSLPALANSAPSVHATSKVRYSRAHALGNSYNFDPRDGWMSVNVTNMPYKYPRERGIAKSTEPSRLDNRSPGLGTLFSNVLKFSGLKGFGSPKTVTITWYTGHDLLNPSCWANGDWSPSDNSFTCATTLHGWHDRPKCFQFIELCNGPKKCIFARVVDSCAGCKPGSQHIDLTRAAFHQLADYDKGILTVQFRHANEPEKWYQDLWGPKH